MQNEKSDILSTASEDFARAILENSPDSLGLLDTEGRVLLINETCRNLISLTDASAAYGKNWRALWPESARLEVDKALAAARSSGRAAFRGWCPVKDVPRFWDVIVTLLPEGGRKARFLTVSRDITDIRRMQDALRWSARSTALTSDAAAQLLQSDDPEAVVEDICQKAMADLDCQYFFNFIFDRQTDSLRLNAFFGVTQDEARRFERLDYGKVLSGCVVRNCDTAGACTARELRTELRDAYGVTAYCCHPLIAQGRVIGTLAFASHTRADFNDAEIEVMETLSHFVSMALSRAQMERALRQSDKRKDDFIAALAHELRNPLAAIHNGLHVLNKTDGAAFPRLRPVLDRQLDLLIRLVDDLLDISRVKTGKIKLKKQRIDLVKIVNASLEQAELLRRSQARNVCVSLPSKALVVNGDSARLVQVFTNLLENAAKFTDLDGLIDVSVTCDDVHAVVSVRDDGPGIPTEKLESIFDLYSQMNCGPGDAPSGLGVGLALARGLVEQHGGKLEARSGTSKCGSEFLVHLPLLPGLPHEDLPGR